MNICSVLFTCTRTALLVLADKFIGANRSINICGSFIRSIRLNLEYSDRHLHAFTRPSVALETSLQIMFHY